MRCFIISNFVFRPSSLVDDGAQIISSSKDDVEMKQEGSSLIGQDANMTPSNQNISVRSANTGENDAPIEIKQKSEDQIS